MKKCLLCGHVERGDALTCSKCGEATWGPVALEPAVVPEVVPVEAPAPEKRRGRR